MRFFRLFLLPSLFLALAAPLRAESPSDVPNPLETRHSWVADNANVLSDEDERRINAILSPLERRSGAEVAVVTVRNLGGKSVEEFANDLFRLWKIGKKDRDNGVVILAAIDDHKLRIDVDYGLQDILTDGQTGEILRSQVTPQFKRGAYGEGLYAGALAVAKKIDPATVEPAATAPQFSDSETLPNDAFAPGVVIPTPSSQSASRPPATQQEKPDKLIEGPGDVFLIILGFLILGSPFIIVIGIIWLVIRWLNRPKRCRKCKAPMRQLPDSEEARSLSPVQMFEQKIGAIDYLVWHCPHCQSEEIGTHVLSDVFKKCPQCHNHTARWKIRNLKHPTEQTLGYDEVTVTCQWPQCGHTGTFRRAVPRLPPVYIPSATTGAVIGSSYGSSHHSSSDSGSSWGSSSSSSSYDSGPSSFGGSDSGGGGGGASDSW